ncbi:uncharacterized protein LOC130084182 [Rhinichthys klamathensis goyatoka]|uniref:uncharacterized protein LOC130084182 n=1 Tax=Rhinichthys klamathensis goyatoka TaxID=3034132 RepID=UPI0024B5F56C|nr:uncharacterized protein LOC130084182 [Rhinichthys klamathensis goyatoka]
METQRILMRSLAVVFFASVIWTITVSADAQQKKFTCCTFVSNLTRANFTDPIIGFRMLKHSPPCVKAVVAETERGEFCLDWRLRWVQEEAKQFFRAQRNKRLTSTPPPASSISKLLTSTPPPASSIISADAKEKKVGTCCTVVSRLTREEFPDPIIGFRMLKHSPPCVRAVLAETERGEFCLDWRQAWVQEEVKQFLKEQFLSERFLLIAGDIDEASLSSRGEQERRNTLLCGHIDKQGANATAQLFLVDNMFSKTPRHYERKLARGVPGTFRSSSPAVRDPISSSSHRAVCGPHSPESVCDNNAERSSH